MEHTRTKMTGPRGQSQANAADTDHKIDTGKKKHKKTSDSLESTHLPADLEKQNIILNSKLEL